MDDRCCSACGSSWTVNDGFGRECQDCGNYDGFRSVFDEDEEDSDMEYIMDVLDEYDEAEEDEDEDDDYYDDCDEDWNMDIIE